MAKYTIDDLLNLLEDPNATEDTLPNTKNTWSRIGDKDKFTELGLESSKLESFLNEWMDNNPYSNIS